MNSNYHWANIALLPLLAGVLLVLLAPLVWAHRHRPTGAAFLVSVIAMSIWAFGYAFELCSINGRTAIFWANIQYFGIPTGPAATLAFIVFMASESKRRPVFWTFLTAFPIVIWAFVWTNPFHFLVRKNIRLVPENGYFVLTFDRGPIYYADVAFCYLCMMVAIITLIRLTFRRNPLTRRQAKTILIGLALPVIANVLGLLGIRLIEGVDLTPMMFALSAVLSADGVFRWSLLTVAPIARDKVVDDLADGIVVLDPDHKVIDANPAAARILGIDPHHMSRSLPGGWALPVDAQSLENESYLDIEERSYFVRRSYLTGAGAAPVGMILQLTDVTEQKRTQEELRRAKEAAEEASEVKSRFVANISHELRTPLNGVIGLADLLDATSLNLDQKDYLKGIKQCSNTLLGLISDVLDFSKLDADAMPITQIPVEIAVLVEEVATVHRFLMANRALTFKASVVGLPPYIVGDPLRLRQILHNLVGNAIKFTERGSITISVSSISETIYEIVVADTGIGIPKHMQSAVFEAFQQADASTSRRFGGTGLGLPITRGLVERMGGTISLTSKESEGTSIRVALPLAVATPNAAEVSEEDIPAGLRVLVAEDNEVNTLVITAMLERLGCTFEHCENGIEAVQSFADSEFDLVLLDIQMPLMDGLEACQVIKERWPTRRTPIYALTANAFEEERERAANAGMDGFLTKPLRSLDLAKALRDAARKSGAMKRR